MSDHFVMNASPFINSRMKTTTLVAMMKKVTPGQLVGRRDTSPNGIMCRLLPATVLTLSANTPDR
jgi:hypothetical protein